MTEKIKESPPAKSPFSGFKLVSNAPVLSTRIEQSFLNNFGPVLAALDLPGNGNAPIIFCNEFIICC